MHLKSVILFSLRTLVLPRAEAIDLGSGMSLMIFPSRITCTAVLVRRAISRARFAARFSALSAC